MLFWLIDLYTGLQLWAGQTCGPQDLNEMLSQVLPSWCFSYSGSCPHAMTSPSSCSPFPQQSFTSPYPLFSTSFPCSRRFSVPVFKIPGAQLQNPSSPLPSSETSHPHLNFHTPTGHESCAASCVSISTGDPWSQDLPHHLTSPLLRVGRVPAKFC